MEAIFKKAEHFMVSTLEMFRRGLKGQVIPMSVPSLTEAQRNEMVRLVHKLAEEARIGAGHARSEGIKALKYEVKAKQLSPDDERRGQTALQKLCDKYIAEVEALLREKAQQIMNA